MSSCPKSNCLPKFEQIAPTSILLEICHGDTIWKYDAILAQEINF